MVFSATPVGIHKHIGSVQHQNIQFGKLETLKPSFETTGGSSQADAMTLLNKKGMGKPSIHVLKNQSQLDLYWSTLKREDAGSTQPAVNFSTQSVVVVALPIGGGSSKLTRSDSLVFNAKKNNLTVYLSEQKGMGTMIPKITWYLAVVNAEKTNGTVNAVIQ
ncbi:MAG: hypothetical protein K2X66_07130 [Cyanobacteria bacterium]|nr:hypothetical protein [Cyanobacteriota bacterium]